MGQGDVFPINQRFFCYKLLAISFLQLSTLSADAVSLFLNYREAVSLLQLTVKS